MAKTTQPNRKLHFYLSLKISYYMLINKLLRCLEGVLGGQLCTEFQKNTEARNLHNYGHLPC